MNESGGMPTPEQAVMDQIKVGESQQLVGADAKREKATHLRSQREINKGIKAEAAAEKQAARQQWWADKKAQVSNMGESIKTGLNNAKEKVGTAKDSVVEGVKSFHEADVQRKERLQDWIADLPAKAYDKLAAADEWVDNKTDAWADRLDSSIDATANKLGSQAESYQKQVKDALLEMQQAKREAKLAIGNIPDENVESGALLKAARTLAETEKKVASLRRMQGVFTHARDKAGDRAKATKATSSVLRRVRGVVTFN